MTRSARYFVVHETRYEYLQPVRLSRQVVHLAPRAMPWQRCLSHSLRITPEPQILGAGDDALGNPFTSFCFDDDHTELSVRASSWVDVVQRDFPPDAETPAWDDVRDCLRYQAGHPPPAAHLEAARFLFESTRVRNKRELAAWTLACFPPGEPLLACVRALTKRIHSEFTFDPEATTVSTPVMTVFAERRGVCQDFAHLMLSCLRSLGLSARYVSGYLLTHPPAGKARLIGADASHAWVSVYCPGYGYVDADPTNGVFTGVEHVTLGWGRDYDDVIPLRGVLLGGGDHSLDIAVTVVPADEYPAVFGAPAPSFP